MIELRAGSHRVALDGDTLFLEAAGDLLEIDIEKYIEFAEQIRAQHGHLYILDDFSRFGTIGSAARKHLASWLGNSSCRGAAIYGASLSSRTLTTLIMGAMRLLGAQPFPVIFVKNEAEGRQWIATQRQELGAK